MHIISRQVLREFWEKHPDSQEVLQIWYADILRAHWQSPSDIKAIYRNASILANKRVVFNIKGNRYRLVVEYRHAIIYIRFVGAHAEYNRIDANTI